MKAWKTLAASLFLGLGSTASAGVAADMLSERALWSDPSARAYLSLGFGASSDYQQSQLRAGLRIDRNSTLQWTQVEPIARIDFDRAGLTEATLNGVPMVARDPVVYQQDGDIVYNWTDWGLVALGAAGAASPTPNVARREQRASRAVPALTSKVFLATVSRQGTARSAPACRMRQQCVTNWAHKT